MFIPTGETPLDILLRIANIVVLACQGLVEFFSTPVMETLSAMTQIDNPLLSNLFAILGGLSSYVIGYDITWIEFLFMSIPIILIYNLIKWIVGIVTGS